MLKLHGCIFFDNFLSQQHRKHPFKGFFFFFTCGCWKLLRNQGKAKESWLDNAKWHWGEAAPFTIVFFVLAYFVVTVKGTLKYECCYMLPYLYSLALLSALPRHFPMFSLSAQSNPVDLWDVVHLSFLCLSEVKLKFFKLTRLLLLQKSCFWWHILNISLLPAGIAVFYFCVNSLNSINSSFTVKQLSD